MKCSAAVFCLSAGIAMASARAHAQVSTNTLAINSGLIRELVEEARTNNPALLAADSRTRAAQLNARAVRTWDDPTGILGGEIFSANGMDPGQVGNIGYGIEQKLPLWGRPGLARKLAATEQHVRAADAEASVAALRSEILQALVAGALAQRIVEIGAEDVAWLESTERAAEARYRSGQGFLGDALEIQNEAAKRKNALETDRLQLEHERFTLNRLLNRAPHAAFPPIALPSVAPAIPLSARLLTLARDNEPMLKVLDHRIEKAEAGARLSRNMRLPDVSLAVEGRQYSGDGELRSGMFSVRVSLPWINREKYRKDYARDQAELKAAELDRDDRVLEIREHLHHFVTGMEAARREAVLEKGEIRVRSSQLLNSRLNEWQAGKGAFRDVLDARRMLLESEVGSARAIAEQYRMLSEMLLWTGTDNFESLFALSSEPPLAHGNKHEMGGSK